MPDMAFDWWNN